MTQPTPDDASPTEPAEGHGPQPPETEAERQTRETIRAVSRLEESN